MVSKRHIAAAAALLMSGGSFAQAGSAFSIPNPIIKPSTYAAAPAGGAGVPAVRPVDPGSSVPPLPPAISPASLPGQSMSTNAPGSEAIIRDTLATFTVTAIVGNKAVLRNNVGYQAAATQSSSQQGGQSQSSNGDSGRAQQANQRQSVIRVKSDVPVFVAGVQLTPKVMESRVEFRISSRAQVIATVMLESNSSHGYVPAAPMREAADPAVATRVSPQSGGSSFQTGGTPGANGSNGLANGNGLR